MLAHGGQMLLACVVTSLEVQLARRFVEHIDGATSGVRHLARVLEDCGEDLVQLGEELTVWPTCPSALSSATDRDSSPVRVRSSFRRRAFSIAITACAAKFVTSSICFGVKRGPPVDT